MALAAAKAAVQIGAFAGVGLQGAPDQVEGLVKTAYQLWRDYVRAQGVGRPRDALGEAQDKVALVHLGGNIKDVTDGGHGYYAPYTLSLSLCMAAQDYRPPDLHYAVFGIVVIRARST